MSAWTLEVLGTARLRGEGVATGRLERKTAALLAYLALEGPAPRSKLAGLLWPDSGEATARNNLSQLLRRLREASRGQVVLTGEALRLSSDVLVDAATLQVLVFSGRYAEAAGLSSELLAGYDYDDCPDFSEWLFLEREQIKELRGEALLAESRRLEGVEDFAAAAAWAGKLLELDPLSEESHRRLMRLYYLLSDRPAALRAFERCKEVLKRELGLEPLPETVALAREIARGAVLPETTSALRPRLPLAVQRPPLLVGREQEWQALEAAWEAGQTIFISGEPGVGKTRLMLDFVSSKGRYGLFWGRPGDAGVPYAMHARSWRAVLERFPDLPLEPWARRELSRLLPELWDEPLPPLTSKEEKVRLYEAKAQLVRLMVARGWGALVVDDLQYIDEASFEAGNYLVAKFVPATSPDTPRSINSFRTGELAPNLSARVQQLVDAGLAALIELKPLGEAAVSRLVASLELPGAEVLAAPLSRFTGGNPLFIVETIKSLAESGSLERFPEHLPPPGRVGPLIRRRLERLSPAALRLARTAAVVRGEFDMELAGTILETAPLTLAEPWQELEGAQILRGNWFSHDLLFEAILETTPEPVQSYLHRRTAQALERRQANPARIADHWLGAGDQGKAVPFLLAAAEGAKAAYRLAEAAGFYEKAADWLAKLGDLEGAFEAFSSLATLLISNGMNESEQGTIVGKLLTLAQTPLQQANARHAEAMLLYTQGHGSKSERAARIGHDHAVVAGNPHLQAKLISDTAAALYLQGRIPEAAKAYQAAYELLDRLGDSADLAAALANLAFILDLQDRSQEAIAHYRKAEQLSLKLGDTAGRIIILNDLGFSLREWGRVRSSLEPLLESERLLAQTFGAIEDQRRNWAQLGESYFHLSDYTRSLDYLQRARALSAESNLPHGFIYLSLAKPYLALGQFELAGAQLEAAAHQPALRERIRGIIWLLKAKLLMWQNQPATAALAAAEPLLDLEHNKAGLSKFLILKAPALPPQTALLHAQRALDIADSLELGGHKIAAETRCAQALLALGRLHEARQHSASARYLMQGYQPLDFYEAEVHFTHYQILKALQDPAAPAQLEECLAWIMDVADSKVPPEYRRSFLTRNPVNKAVLEAVRMVAPERLEAPENLAPSAPARPLSERLGGLTEREAQVLRLVAAAMTDREIAGKLRISPATVSKHIANLLAKTSLHNRVELTRWALEHGFNQSKAQRQS